MQVLEKTVLKKGDMVQVMSGKEKGKTGKVLRVLKSEGRIVLEKLNLVKRHTKPSQKNPQGGLVDKESSLAYSNVLLLCPKCNKGVRVRKKVEGDTKKRICVKCDETL